MTGIMKVQIDWIPLSMSAAPPKHGQTLAVMAEWLKFTLLTRDESPDLVDWYNERPESAAELAAGVKQPKLPGRFGFEQTDKVI